MARSLDVAALALILGACGGDPLIGTVDAPSVPSSLCATSADCTAGHWCNPKPVDSNPADTICEPRGATAYNFDTAIYPNIESACAGCHVAGVADSQGGNITVFAGGPDVAFASLTADGVDCTRTPHKVCVNEPKNSSVVARLLTHLDASGNVNSKLLPLAYSDPWLQRLLHWIAAGATRSGFSVDAPLGSPDAPIEVADAPVPDAPGRPDARPIPDALIPPPGPPTITSPTANATTPSGQIPMTWTAAAPNGSNITRYDVTARVVSSGATTTVTCNAPFTNPPCSQSGSSISATVTGLTNCTGYDVTVTATNANGSTDSAPVTDVTPRVLPTAPTGLSVAKVTGQVGQLLFSWSASNPNGCGGVSYTVEVTPPSGVSCGGAAGAACLNGVGASTSFTMTTNDAVCPYPTTNCSNRRFWSFRVRAANNGGTTGFSGPVAGSPRMGYIRDNIFGIFSAARAQPAFPCVGCHFKDNNVLVLNDGTDTTHRTSFDSINANHVVDTTLPNGPSNSLLHLCPTNDPSCGHGGGLIFNSGSIDDNAIVQWITDGAVF